MNNFNVKNLMAWIEENRDSLKPPVGNKEIYPGGDFIVMAVGGPNQRQDYHYNETPEFFYQIQGDIALKVIEDGKFREISIREGDIYLLSPKTPHSPQRPANTIGLVIEQKRRPEHQDGFQWYCDNCHSLLYEEYFPLQDIVKQLPETFARYYAQTERHTCQHCGHVHQYPGK
ncbi:MAG: 3-hydroxyanthranilate 3,4-dioxygenase [Microscillaceae bacterium]